ncbi:ABC transporter permease [Paenibacillus sanfengchensis]|uniref:ABC transporter permease n=1 Tax=Paenibacillus sanfengchensis TaxID=3119819 RepID=UPI002FE0268B
MNSLTIAWNMIRQTVGTKKGMIMHILLPCIVISLAVALLGQERPLGVQIVYVNQDTGKAGAYLLEELAAKPNYSLKEVGSEDALREEVTENRAEAGFMIPSGFTDLLLAGQKPKLPMYELKMSEGTYTLRLTLEELARGAAAMAGLVSASQPDVFGAVLDQTRKHAVSPDKTDLQLYPKPGLNVVTGFTLMFLMSLVGSTVGKILEERRRRTMARMYSAPVRAWEITLGHFLGSFTVGISQIALVLIFSGYVLKYDYDVPMLLHFIVLAAFMLVAMGIASAVAGIMRNPQNVGMLNSLIITPTCMLGGCFWPISYMPEFMQKAANFVPQKWAIEAVEKLSAGGGLGTITLPLLILGLMALILLAIGSSILRPAEANVTG